MTTTKKNQCMGCQAGWKTKDISVWRNIPTQAYTVHLVEGGYPGEIVQCTKERYD